MEKIAVLSDIHSNLEALLAVLNNIERENVSKIFNLGDFIGYGPDPIPCLQVVQSFDLNLRGNHEDAILNKPDNFSYEAKEAIKWTRKVIRQKENKDFLGFLFMLPAKGFHNNWLLVHGSPCYPVFEYLVSDLITSKEGLDVLRQNFNQIQNVCFVGHTHVPGFFIQRNNGIKYIYPPYINNRLELDAEAKYIINPGSVGQPRDGVSLASYLIIDGNTIIWKRVPYDKEQTMAKIRAIPDLPNNLAGRLGRLP